MYCAPVQDHEEPPTLQQGKSSPSKCRQVLECLGSRCELEEGFTVSIDL